MTEATEQVSVEPPKKKRVNSKKKGSGFEGHIGKVLAEHLAPMKFRRSQSSGAILGGMNEKFMEHFSEDAKALFIGDVVPTNEADVVRDHKWKLKFTLECKFYKSAPNLEHLFNGPSLFGWFEQASTDASKLSKEPLLLFKYNHTNIYCCVNPKTIGALPVGVTKTMTICSTDQQNQLLIFQFKEALLDLDWWKVKVTS